MRTSITHVLALAVIGFGITVATDAFSQVNSPTDPPRPPSLKTVPVPEPTNLAEFVSDRQAAIRLGKALFWDMQVGSDGVQACGSCHFSSGLADTRSKNQLSPGLKRITATGAPNPDRTFHRNLGPVGQVTGSDFPFFPASNDVLSSQGVRNSVFLGIGNGPADLTRQEPDPDGFRVGSTNTRRVEPRNTPTVVNAVFNHRQFWDGRADNVFNGVNEMGDRDPNARVFRADSPTNPVAVQIRLEDSSLASQAVVPPVSGDEMSARGRTMRDIGKKFARYQIPGQPASNLRPLALQLVHPEDSVLGPLSRWPQKGLNVSNYPELIQAAFHRQWWDSPKLIRVGTNGAPTVIDPPAGPLVAGDYSLMQYNFSLFFGLAIQLYEATLVADHSPYDQFMDGNSNAISAQAILGVDLFRSQARGQCITCHEGAELSGASVRQVRASPTRIRDGQAMDRGFNNIGVLETLQDLSLGAKDDLGNWLSTVKRLTPAPPEPIVVDGAFKVPGLRNVELTAPYFHNGGQVDLSAVLDFYDRAGDAHEGMVTLDGTQVELMSILGLTPEEKAALLAFLVSLTDERVRFQQAPFDHPQLFIPNGPGAPRMIMPGDPLFEIPAVGRFGGQPQKKFLEP
ncbi:MAG: cytochrome C peroxidase [Nitrospira sp.]|nr:MAG: cytochrome C peroxidase [Nitrospira sp.]